LGVDEADEFEELGDELHPAAARPMQAITSSGRRQRAPGFVLVFVLRRVTCCMS
jgi:hypothetical protein